MLNKLIALPLLIVSVFGLLEFFKVYSLPINFDVLLIGAGLMIVLHIVNLIMAQVNQNKISLMHIITAIVFVIPAIGYIVNYFFSFLLFNEIPLILSVLMLAEGLYAMH